MNCLFPKLLKDRNVYKRFLLNFTLVNNMNLIYEHNKQPKRKCNSNVFETSSFILENIS